MGQEYSEYRRRHIVPMLARNLAYWKEQRASLAAEIAIAMAAIPDTKQWLQVRYNFVCPNCGVYPCECNLDMEFNHATTTPFTYEQGQIGSEISQQHEVHQSPQHATQSHARRLSLVTRDGLHVSSQGVAKGPRT